MLIATSKEDPDRSHDLASITRPFVVPTPPPSDDISDNDTSDYETSDHKEMNEEPIAPVRGRKRPASAISSSG